MSPASGLSYSFGLSCSLMSRPHTLTETMLPSHLPSSLKCVCLGAAAAATCTCCSEPFRHHSAKLLAFHSPLFVSCFVWVVVASWCDVLFSPFTALLWLLLAEIGPGFFQYYVIGDFAAEDARQFLDKHLRQLGQPEVSDDDWGQVHEVSTLQGLG